MIKLLDLYIGRSIASATFFSVFTLTALSGLIRFVEQLRYVGRNDYGMSEAALFVVFSVARDIEIYFPMGALLGGLLGLGALASNSELIVMQAAGMSKLQIVKSAMKTTMLMVAIVVVIGQWIAPQLEIKAETVRDNALYGQQTSLKPQAMWLKDGTSFVHVADANDSNELQGVTVYEFSPQLHLSKVIYAELAKYQNDQWQMQNVRLTELDNSQIKLTELAERSWQTPISPDKLTVVNATPEAWSLADLADYLDYLNNNEQDDSRYQLAYWRKLFQPVTVAVMMLVALSFIFGPLRSTSMGARILLGVITGFGFFITNRIFGPVVLVFDISPIIGALAPSLVFTTIAIYYLKKH
ncbi:LPS export ABC transporter permease LptG [Gayadomonas joobiniege]|uniref:LPS export ABC transporter permease LptG n=1 Tax=Gayadomonas joobiniege TaxID=1234606 RepID=UPI000381F12E|nr:LPS export ABC transporter permease LptG [Gayadomonas joobiniege]